MALSKVWDGASWVLGRLKSWNGASWDDKANFYDGATFVPLYLVALVEVVGANVIVVDNPPDSGYQLTSGGAERSLESGTFATIGTWLLSGSPGDYHCRMTMVSGTTFSGSPTGSWLSLSTSRLWTLVDPAAGLPSVQGEGLIEIRDASTLDILDSATVNLSSRRTV